MNIKSCYFTTILPGFASTYWPRPNPKQFPGFNIERFVSLVDDPNLVGGGHRDFQRSRTGQRGRTAQPESVGAGSGSV